MGIENVSQTAGKQIDTVIWQRDTRNTNEHVPYQKPWSNVTMNHKQAVKNMLQN